MAAYTLKAIDDLEAIYGGAFKRARAELGIRSFGLQVIDMPPHATAYPEHDHSQDGQEEVYVPLSGSADVEVDGDRVRLEPGMLLAVGPGIKRKLLPGGEGMRVLIIGGVPGSAYEPVPITELGGPDPSAGTSG